MIRDEEHGYIFLQTISHFRSPQPYFYSKILINHADVFILFLFSIPEFAVTTRNKINFFTSNWTSVRSVSHGFVESTALALDEAKDTIYFNDEMHSDWAIFSIQSSNFTSHERIVQKLNDGKGMVTGIAFDPVENVLFWSDAPNAIIYQMTLGGQGKNVPEIFIKLEESQRPDSIAIDVCRRKLYWTNRNLGNRTIEQISLEGDKRKVIIQDNLDLPLGIVVDQHAQRLFWVDDKMGEHFSIDSANLDGTDRQIVLSSALGHRPRGIAVDKNYVYWTDRNGPAIWSARKNLQNETDPIKVHEFDNTEIIQTYAILAREHLLTAGYPNECKTVVDLIKSNYRTESTTAGISSNLLCLNQGQFDPKSNSCKCQRGYKGDNCEMAVCLNYCVKGECIISETGDSQCKCFDGFDGDRCEIDLCNNYCLNGGHCKIQNQKPICECQKMYSGHRCYTMNFKEMCTRFCNKENIDDIILDLETVCNK